MDTQLLEGLLYQDESEALDFKVEQYPFEKATDEFDTPAWPTLIV